MKKVILCLFVFLTVQILNSEVTVEKKWYSKFGLIDNTCSPLHTYGVSNIISPCRLYDLTTGELVFQVDTTKVIITDLTGKTFFVIDSLNQKFYVYDLSKKEMIKELTYRNYIHNRAVSDSLMFEFDTENQILRLWNIYEDKIVRQNDLKSAANYPNTQYFVILNHTFDSRFIKLVKGINYHDGNIYDCEKNEFLPETNTDINYPYNYVFMNRSNKLIYLDKMKLGNDTIETPYFRFYDLENKKLYKDVKIKNYRKGLCLVYSFILSKEDEYIIFHIPTDFFWEGLFGIYDIENDTFNDKIIGLSNAPVFFSNSLIVVMGNEGYRVKTPTSIQDKFDSMKISISPNPAGDYITITIDRWTPLQKWSPSEKVQIFNTLGIEVSSTGGAVNEVDGDGYRIDISHLPTGIYFIKIGDRVEKFVKK